MGLLNIFKTRIDNIELAEELLKTLSVGFNVNPKYSKEIKKIEKENIDIKTGFPDRQKILLKVISLIDATDTPQKRFLLAKAYAWSKVEYREKSIEYLELYLNNDVYVNQYSQETNNRNLFDMYNFLCKAYLGTYNFEKALNVAEKTLNIDKSNPIGYQLKTEVLIKTNKLIEAKEWLECQKKSPYYKFNKKYLETSSENFFFFTINRLLNDIEEKIKKGYVYRPRKK
jgi:tetratricopeptide (TPR) repeat protein